MFYIKSKCDDSWHKWSNDICDDFLQFVPKSLGCSSEDLVVLWSKEDNGPEGAVAFNPWPYDANGRFTGNGPLNQ